MLNLSGWEKCILSDCSPLLCFCQSWYLYLWGRRSERKTLCLWVPCSLEPRWCSCLPGCSLLCWHFAVKSVTSILLPHFSPGCSEPGRAPLVGLGSHWLQAWVSTMSSCWSNGPQVHVSLCNKVTVLCGISVWSVDLASAPHSPWEPRIALESWTFEIPSTLGFLMDTVVCQVGARGSYSPGLEWGTGNKQFLLTTVFPNCTSPSRGQSLEWGHSGHTWLTVLALLHPQLSFFY